MIADQQTPEACFPLKTKQAQELFAKAGVHTEEELESRYHLEVERYIKDLEIEIASLKEIATTMVLPAAFKHQANVAGSVAALSAVGADKKLVSAQLADVVFSADRRFESRCRRSTPRLRKPKLEDLDKKAAALGYAVSDAMAAVREACDKLETIVDDGIWPPPKYREMLFLF